MADVDTSSYPKPAAPTNFLDTANKFQQLESNKYTIDKQKLDLVNQRFGEMSKGFAGLINSPDLDEDKIRKYTQDQVKLVYITPEMGATFLGTLPPTQGLPPDKAKAALIPTLETHMQHAQSIKDAIDFHYGQQGTMDVGGATVPTATSPKFGIRSTGLPIQQGIGAGTHYVDQSGQEQIAGTQPIPGTVAQPPARPGMRLPIAQAPQAAAPAPAPAPQTMASPASAPPNAAVPPAPSFADRFSGDQRGGQAPLYAEGKQAYNEDQGNALARATAMKPAEQALKLLPGLQSGPGTATFNKAIAGLKAFGILNTEDAEKDPTAIYQIVQKKLSQYVQSSPLGQRSDAAQSLAEASSPSPGTQINPALVKLTRDALALDKVQIARPNAFEGNKYEDYIKHRATFPQSVDERAFGLKYLPEEERNNLVKNMLDKYKKNPNDPEAKKFLHSYDLAKKQDNG